MRSSSEQSQSSPSDGGLNRPTEPEEGNHDPTSLRIKAAGDAPGAPDPFDPDALRLRQDFAASAIVRKVITAVPVRKPHREEFIRVKPGDDSQLVTMVLETRTLRETYLVERDLQADLVGEISPVCLVVAVNRQGDMFVWPLKLPHEEGRTNSWNDSALAAAKLAESRWVRIVSNMAAGMYDTYEAAAVFSEPSWPDLSLHEILKLAFRNRLINSADHPVLRALRGEV